VDSSHSFSIAGAPGHPSLEAVWVGEGRRVAVVAPPHPLMGGHLSNPVVQAVAEGLASAGVRCLLFNWRGVGESDGDPSGAPEDADRDYAAALAVAASAKPVSILSGYSFGGATAIRAAASRGDVDVFAVAPPPVLFAEASLAPRAGHLMVVAAALDVFATPPDLELALRRAPGARFETIAAADHFFSGGATRQVRDLAAEFAASLGEQ
jgi:hypothetical protein